MVFCDNQVVIVFIKNFIMYVRIRYVEVKMYFIRKSVEDKVIEMYYVFILQNTAYIFIKVLLKLKFR